MKPKIKQKYGPLLLFVSTTALACTIAGTDSDCLTLNETSNQSSPNSCPGVTYPGKITTAGVKKNVSTGSFGANGHVGDGFCKGTWTSDGQDCTGNTFEKQITGDQNVKPDSSSCGNG